MGNVENAGYQHFSPLPTMFIHTSQWTLSKTTILDCSKLKESADDNYKFEENSRKFFKWIENTLGKGEIALYEQFLLFPQCFQKYCTGDM